MSVDINKNRYRLIVLLYISFVCLSVLTIPSSLLHTNIYMIKTMDYQEKSISSQIEFAKKIILQQEEEYTSDSAKNFYAIQQRIHHSTALIESVDQLIVADLAKQHTTVFEELTNKRKINKILLKDSLIYKIKDDLFDLASYIDKQPYRLNNSIRELLPVQDFITIGSGKEIAWRKYLLLDKPASISYMHLKRIKFLLLENERAYLLAVLRSLNLLPAYYSIKNKKAYSTDSEQDKIIKETPEKVQPIKLDDALDSLKQKESKIESLLKRQLISTEVLTGLHIDHLYVGIQNELLYDPTSSLEGNYEISFQPKATTSIKDKIYRVSFSKPGVYMVQFKELATGILLFQKRITVDMLPDPYVKLNMDNVNRNVLSSKDLFRLNNLVVSMPIPELPTGTANLNGFRATVFAKNGEQLSVYNYGEVFQNELQRVIGKLKQGDIFLIDNITIAMGDATTRTISPLVYKIVE